MEKEKGSSAVPSTDGRTHGKTDECPDDEISYRVAVLCSAAGPSQRKDGDTAVEPSLRDCASAYDKMPAHQGRTAPAASCSYALPPNYSSDLRDHDDLIKPRKLLNPVKCSRSHQELHRELMTCCKRSSGGVRVESNKPELERVLECRRRDRLLRERKLEEEAHRKISPLEAELRKRHQALEEMELEQQQGERDKLTAPEFVKVKENLRRTSCADKEEKQV